MFLPPSSATLFLYLWHRVEGMFLQRKTVREEKAREGASVANLERLDLTEALIGLSERGRLRYRW